MFSFGLPVDSPLLATLLIAVLSVLRVRAPRLRVPATCSRWVESKVRCIHTLYARWAVACAALPRGSRSCACAGLLVASWCCPHGSSCELVSSFDWGLLPLLLVVVIPASLSGRAAMVLVLLLSLCLSRLAAILPSRKLKILNALRVIPCYLNSVSFFVKPNSNQEPHSRWTSSRMKSFSLLCLLFNF